MCSSQQSGIGGVLENVEKDSSKKERKQYLRSMEWKLWILENYEYAKDRLVFLNEIIQHSVQDKENLSKGLSRYILGWLIKDIFAEKVRVVLRGPRGSKQRAYLNLQRIQKSGTKVCSSPGSLFSIFPSLVLPSGWHSSKDGSDQVSFIRHEIWEFSKQRGTTELRVSQISPSEITLQVKSHGCSIDLKKDLGLERLFKNVSFERQILLAIKLIEHSNLCFGFPLNDSERVMTMSPHLTGEFESMSDDRLKGCKRVFAQNCLVLSGPSKICHSCSYLKTVDSNRRKRKANQTTISPSCNKRYMTKEEVEYQLKMKQMARRNAVKREACWREKFGKESVHVDDEDQQDLLQMAGSLKESDFSEGLQCLWEQQKILRKILRKSKNGYRGHSKYHKNKRDQKSGRNREIVEAKKKNLKECAKQFNDQPKLANIMEDRSAGKKISHNHLHVFVQKHSIAGLKRVYTKDQLSKLCIAYGIRVRTNHHKRQLAQSLVQAVSSRNSNGNIPHPQYLNRLSATTKLDNGRIVLTIARADQDNID